MKKTIKNISVYDAPEAEALEENLPRVFTRGIDSFESWVDETSGIVTIEARYNDGGSFFVSGDDPETAEALMVLMLN